ncbi:unnamed protein product, partial [Ectocarpus sp. 4 AP-2014]
KYGWKDNVCICVGVELASTAVVEKTLFLCVSHSNAGQKKLIALRVSTRECGGNSSAAIFVRMCIPSDHVGRLDDERGGMLGLRTDWHHATPSDEKSQLQRRGATS